MRTIYYTDPQGNRVPVTVNINSKLDKKQKKDKKNKKDSKLRRKIAATALVLTIGVGAVVTACSVFKGNDETKNFNPSTDTTISNKDDSDNFDLSLRFNPNSKEGIVDSAVFLIEEAARGGKELDAEDAVLAAIAANSDEINAGFMGELFGERANQTYTYSSIVDAYLRVCMIQNENVGVTKSSERAFNIEDVFANAEDYSFLCNIRDLVTQFNNSTDKQERAKITEQLNQIATDLCDYDVYDISSSAGIVSMLTLDGMRIVTNTSDNPILHDDIRDEMFGNGDYACKTEATYVSEEGISLQTAYSNRVADLKLDSLKSKLENAVLVEGKTVILDEIISQVKEKTKDVKISDFDPVAEINAILEKNRTVPYEYENAPGDDKENYSPVTPEDDIQNIGGEDVIVIPGNSEEEEIEPTVPQPTEPKKDEPEISIEENVTPEEDEEIEDNREDAEEELVDEWEKAQADSNQGSIDGEKYGKNGWAKPSFAGKSEYYINAFNATYDFWYNEFQKRQAANETTSPTVDAVSPVSEENVNPTEIPEATTDNSLDLSNLSVDELNELKNAALGEAEYSSDEKQKTM